MKDMWESWLCPGSQGRESTHCRMAGFRAQRDMVVVLHEPESLDFPEVCFNTEGRRGLGSVFAHHSLSIFPVPPHPAVVSN